MKKLAAFALTFAFALFDLAYYATYKINPPPKESFRPNVAPPDLSRAFADQQAALAAGGGWYVTMDEDFDGSTLPEPWVPSPHGLRNQEYWCDNMLCQPSGGTVKILAAKRSDNVCDICPKEGEFTSGIETRKMAGGKSVPTFEQAFGYYECRVRIPKHTGLWSAFWLQANSQGRLGAHGKDGTEIDIYESAFLYENPNMTGNALLWDGYDNDWNRVADCRTVTDSSLYEGWHTYGLLWTPQSYTFFVDGKATWQTNAGGVSRVPSFVRLTVEIRRGETGPYGMRLGEFTNTNENPAVFEIDYVKIWQNTAYLKAIRSPEDFWALKTPFWRKK
ncbi:MAG: glycoside hydrolase family 16 protein [Oscillospiraceae bacterium]|jgi:hypothetical protein|nr:glycoside hydrolase family 16 protein [Oscillospiraceae bacterium]